MTVPCRPSLLSLLLLAAWFTPVRPFNSYRERIPNAGARLEGGGLTESNRPSLIPAPFTLDDVPTERGAYVRTKLVCLSVCLSV